MTKISIIIPAFNSERYIRGIHEAICKQKFDGSYEIILVDNQSSDLTKSVAQKCGFKVFSIERGVTIGQVRNFAVQHASGEVLAFLDSDCLPDENWLSLGVNFINENPRIGIVGGGYIAPQRATWVQRAWTSIRRIRKGRVNYLPSGNFFIKKSTFLEFGGFDPNFETGEDFDLCFRIGKIYDIIFKEDLGVVHFGEPKNLKEKFKKEFWYGKSSIDVMKRKKVYLSLFSTLIFGILLLLTLICTFLVKGRFIIGMLICILAFIVFNCIYYCFKAKNFKYIFHLIPIFIVYHSARFLSFINRVIMQKANFN